MQSKREARTVLLVDDEPNLLLLVRTTLENHTTRVLEAANANDALDLLRNESIDLAILDWMMPGMSGIELTKAIRKEHALSGVQVIMLTARGAGRDRENAVAAGAAAYLVKPFSPLQLIETVERVFAHRSEEGAR